MAVDYLTTDEAATLARRSRKTIYRAIQCGDLRAFRVASRYLIQPSDVRRWVEETEVRPRALVPDLSELAPALTGSLAALRAIEEAA